MKSFREYINESNRIITDAIQSEFNTFLTLKGQSVINGFYLVEYGDKIMYVDDPLEVENYVRYILQKNELYYTKLNTALNNNLSLNYSKLIETVSHLTSNVEDKKDETLHNDNTSTTTNDLNTNNNIEITTTGTNTTTDTGTVGITGSETPGGISTTAKKPFDSTEYIDTEKVTQSGTNTTTSTTTNDLTNTLSILNTVKNEGDIKNTGTVGIIADYLQTLITNNVLEKIDNSNSTTTENNINEILSNINEYINIYNYNLWTQIIKDLNSVLTIRTWDTYIM